MLQYFLNLPIRSKLLLPTIIMIVGFLIAAGTYWQSLQSIAASEYRQHRLDALSKSMCNYSAPSMKSGF